MKTKIFGLLLVAVLTAGQFSTVAEAKTTPAAEPPVVEAKAETAPAVESPAVETKTETKPAAEPPVVETKTETNPAVEPPAEETKAEAKTVPVEPGSETLSAPVLTNGMSVAEYVLSRDPQSAPPPETQRPETLDADHVKIFPFSSSIVIKGVFERSGFYFQIPSYWDVQYALAQIEFTVSPLIVNIPASLTFFINNTPIYSCAVDYKLGASQITFVKIPINLLKEGFNEFAVTGYVRLYDDDGCLDDFSGASWVRISEQTSIEVGYNLQETNNQLKYFPYPLISTMDETGDYLSFFVPDSPLEEELKAAFMLRALLGNETDKEDRIGFYTFSSLLKEKENALIIARYDRLPADVASVLPELHAQEEGAVIYEYQDSGRTVLVLTAAEETDLWEGACLLMDSDRISQEKTPYAFVPRGSAEYVVSSRTLDALVEDGETVKGITGNDGIEFIGPFHQESFIYLPFSGGFVLGEGGKVDLRFRYSDNLDFDRSMITVYWGSTPLASKKLEKENANGDTLSFLMPSDVVGTYASNFRIAFDLELEELYCTKRADQMPWAYVSGDSTLYLPAGNGSFYDLSLRPYPFQRLGLFNNLAVVVPDEMSASEIALFGRLAALTGTNVRPYGVIDVFFASDFQAENENRHVITLGTLADNSFLRELNDHLSFSYSEDGTRFKSNEQLLLSEEYAKNLGVIQIIRSPYQEGKAILAACAVSDFGLDRIEQYLTVQENSRTLSGDAFLIDSDLETKNYTFLKEETSSEITLRQRVEEHKDAIVFTLLSTGAMLLLLIAAVIILIRYHRNRREEANK